MTVRDGIPQWAVRIVVTSVGAVMLIVLSLVIGDRVSLGNAVQSNVNRITRLEAQQEATYNRLQGIDDKLDRIINCQVNQQLARPC